MIGDPEPRPDGICALDGCGKKLPPLAVEARDPFHSGKCARAWYAVAFAADTRTNAAQPAAA